ncbi:PP2C family protein-serine/threonine phosphatase [Actinomadura sp. KC345]|uniref:PP2C family protein-serine/threonine phosphatase n=1 Tax=Actinomadura sp. KC345 TaxID=2530371 RepID=UPI001A9FAA42|nr:PP2C family protein-serine/threonine phosphatase [Actinomadura sp. KC345]
MILWLLGIAAALAVTGIVLDREIGLAPFLVFLPTLIAGRGTVRQTVVTSVCSTLLIFGALLLSPLDAATAASVIVFAVVLNGLAVGQVVQRVRQEEEILRLRSAAAALQRQILNPFPLVTDELVVHGLYEPVEEDSRVGGDIYEVMATPYGSRVLIADVQGKGLPSISTAFAVLNSFREAALTELTLTAVVEALENSVLRRNSFAAQRDEMERFVTALVLEVGPETQAEAINCGHVPPYLLQDGRSGRVPLGKTSLPLGLGSLDPEPRAAERFDFPRGSTLLLFTDGVTEARNPSGAFYPLRERMADRGDLRAADIAPAIYRDLQQHTQGRLADDTALLVLRRSG